MGGVGAGSSRGDSAKRKPTSVGKRGQRKLRRRSSGKKATGSGLGELQARLGLGPEESGSAPGAEVAFPGAVQRGGISIACGVDACSDAQAAEGWGWEGVVGEAAANLRANAAFQKYLKAAFDGPNAGAKERETE